MNYENTNKAESWLAFELNILRRLDFKSIALPNSGNPALGAYLKNWDVRVVSNDFLNFSYLESYSAIENNDQVLSDEETDLLLEDAYVPQYELKNPLLKNWFGETDAWWFDNMRSSIERLDNQMSKAIASHLVFQVGDYALSFDDETRRLKQPFSATFRRFKGVMPHPIDNGQANTCHNKSAKEFTAENYTDVMFLRLPHPRNDSLRRYVGNNAWKEEWIFGNREIWDELEAKQTGNLGGHVETRSQYMSLLEELFMTASHIPQWAIVHTENNFVTTQDVVEAIGKVRRVDTIFTKDFSELMGTKAVLITA